MLRDVSMTSSKLLLALGLVIAFSFAQPVKADRHAQAGPTQIVSVPDGGTTMSLLGLAFLGVAALRRKLRP
jgi:hypothetical protein